MFLIRPYEHSRGRAEERVEREREQEERGGRKDNVFEIYDVINRGTSSRFPPRSCAVRMNYRLSGLTKILEGNSKDNQKTQREREREGLREVP